MCDYFLQINSKCTGQSCCFLLVALKLWAQKKGNKTSLIIISMKWHAQDVDYFGSEKTQHFIEPSDTNRWMMCVSLTSVSSSLSNLMSHFADVKKTKTQPWQLCAFLWSLLRYDTDSIRFSFTWHFSHGHTCSACTAQFDYWCIKLRLMSQFHTVCWH